METKHIYSLGVDVLRGGIVKVHGSGKTETVVIRGLEKNMTASL